MRWWLLGLCACNQVFGLERTHPYDESPPDAHLECPAFGTAPAFGTLLSEVSGDTCTQYTESRGANLAMAYCNGGVDIGPLTGPFATVVPNSTNTLSLNPRLAADGDRFTLISTDLATVVATFKVYTRDGMSWTPADSTIAVSTGDATSAITSSPDHHLLLWHLGVLHEIDADTGLDITTYMPSELGIVEFGSLGQTGIDLGLTHDGLRLVALARPLSGGTEIAMYTDRQHITDRFGPMQPLPGVPGAEDLFMLDDCSRIYYSSNTVGALFYAWEQAP